MMRGSLTRRYTRIHRALLLAAHHGRVRPSAARVLLAIADRGGQTVGHADLAADLETDGGHVRTSLAALYARGLATGGHPAPDVPAGECGCGCGKRPELAVKTDRVKGWVKGQPKPFLPGHYDARNTVVLTNTGLELAEEIREAAGVRS